MAGQVSEKTECYKCEVEITATAGQVHPLCAECEEEHDRWFAEQLGMLGS